MVTVMKDEEDGGITTLMKKGKNIWQEYTECSSIHGIKYLGHVPMRISIFGKFFWFFILIAGFFCVVLMVQKFWQRYQLIPFDTIIVSFNTPKTRIDFPAVTICPTIPPPTAMREKMRKQIEKVPADLTEGDVEFLIKHGADMSHPYVPFSKDMDINKMQRLLAVNNLTLQQFIPLISRPCHRLFESCWFAKRKVNCSQIFHFSYSYKGLCCSFNYILEYHLTLRSLSRNIDWSVVQRSSLIGIDGGLTVIFKRDLFKSLNAEDSLEHVFSNSVGCLVIIHPTVDYPSDEYPVYIVQANRETQLSMYSADVIKKTQNDIFLSDYARCLKYDSDLPFFPGYLNSNCYISCQLEASLEICGCIHYYYQPMAVYASKRVCDYVDIPCLTKNRDKIRQVAIDHRKLSFKCNCQNSCRVNQFTARANYIMTENPEYCSSPVYRSFKKDRAILRVFWSSQDQNTIHSYPALDGLQLIASIGGIFSLFLGCSFLSIIEIFYFIGLLSRSLMPAKKHAKLRKA
ncbi:sodium channel protein Nach-like isoform X2 [Prorops nasuta]|uniref:sodium channel protein Nach-like isoform X2 n=1 Tax=Prorops nasuta TaxID=863751 RepID=UPI0034CF1B8F